MKNDGKIYGAREVMEAIETLRERGFTIHVIRENVVSDDYLCEAPECPKEGYFYYNYIFTAVYLNEWSDGYKMQRCRKVPQKIWDAIDAYCNA